jgi:hypothetical protein
MPHYVGLDVWQKTTAICVPTSKANGCGEVSARPIPERLRLAFSSMLVSTPITESGTAVVSAFGFIAASPVHRCQPERLAWLRKQPVHPISRPSP